MPERKWWDRYGPVVLLAVAYLLFTELAYSIALSFEALQAPQSAASGGGGISGEGLLIRWFFTVLGLAVAESAVAVSALDQAGPQPSSSGSLKRVTVWTTIADRWTERRPYWWWRVAATVGAYGLAQAVANWVNTQWQGDHTAAAAGFDTSNNVWSALAKAASAGIGEELILVAALVTVLERTGLRFRWILAIGIVARLLFHVHFGAGTAGIALWAAVALVAYYYWRSIIPMVLLHTWHNLTAFWPSPSWWASSTALWVIPAVCAAAAAAAACIRHYRTTIRRTTAPAEACGGTTSPHPESHAGRPLSHRGTNQGDART